MTRVSVVIPLHNGGDDLCRCLQALAASIQPPDEVIVVDDASTDGSAALARTLGARVLTLSHGPQGPAVARNRGAAVAQGDILVFLDADVAISPDAMDQIVAAFRREPDLAALFGSYDDAPAATDFLSQYKNLFHHYVHQTACEEASTFFGACGAIRRDVFLALGGYDERYRQPSIEDIELGYRLTGAGHRIRLCKTLQVKHLKGWDVVSLLKADFFHRALPWTELILRDRRFINDLNLQFSSRVSVMLVYGLLGALVGVWWWPGSIAAAGVLMLVLLALNAPLYRFFQQKHGLRFAVQTIPWHWFYYFYSGLAFAIGIIRYLCRRWRPPRASLPTAPEGWSDTERRLELY